MGIETRKTFHKIPITRWKDLSVGDAVNYTRETLTEGTLNPFAPVAIVGTRPGRAIASFDNALEIHVMSPKTGEWELDQTIPSEILISGFAPEQTGLFNRAVKDVFRAK